LFRSVDYAVIGRGAGGLEAVVEASTATHAILFIRRVLRKVSVSVEEARHLRIFADEWQKRAREAESLLAESHTEIQRLSKDRDGWIDECNQIEAERDKATAEIQRLTHGFE